MRAGEPLVEPGRPNRCVTQPVLFTLIISVYMEFMRDSAIAEFNQQNVAGLETNLQASQDRFEVGDLTRTDVAQSEARLSVARGQLELTLAQLDTSLENYRSEEHTSELQSLMRISYADFCLKQTKHTNYLTSNHMTVMN